MNLRIIPTLFVKGFIRMAFFIFCLIFPINEKKITFASYRSSQLEGNLKYVYNELESRYNDYQIHFLLKKFDGSLKGKVTYFFHILRATYYLATSKYFFVDDYYFPIYVIKPREETEIIQLWHAAGAFKKFGYSTIGKSFGPSPSYLKHVPIHSNYTKVYVSSKKVVPHYAEAFNMSEDNIFPLGLPRTDYFFNKGEKDKAYEKFYQHYPQFQHKKVLLYAPTFRGSSHHQSNFSLPFDLSLFKREIGDEYALLIHLHPYMKTDLTFDRDMLQFAAKVDDELSIEELLMVTDILITDYSSIIFDFSLLNRPIVFLANDLEEYMKERDFYFDFQAFIPGPFFTEMSSFIYWLKNGEFDYEKLYHFRKTFFDYLDGQASKRIVDHLFVENK